MGILNKEELLLADLVLALNGGEYAIQEVQNWVIDTLNGIVEIDEPDILELLSQWGKSGSILHYLNKMDEHEQDEVLGWRPDLNFKELLGRQGTLEGFIDGIDKTDTELFESTIDKQLMKRVGEWRERLKLFKSEDLDDSDNSAEDYLEDLSEERDFLEYARIGILLIKARYPHFKGIKQLDAFSDHIDETDKAFKQLLGKRRELVFWADPTFWWRHKPE